MKRLTLTTLRKTSLIVTILFFLSPLFALPIILLEIYNKKKYALVLFLLFLSLVAFLYPPTGDLYRYYNIYFINFKGISYNEIFDFYIFDILWYSILYILANLNLSFQFSIFISAIIQFSIIIFFLKKNGIIDLPISIFRLLLIVSSFLFLGLWINFELRFILALSFFLLEIYLLVNRKFKYYIIFFILSSLCHLSFLFFSFLLLTVYLFMKYVNLFTATIIVLVVNIVAIIIGTYLDQLGFAKAGYITEQSNWAEDTSMTLKFFRDVLRGLPYYVLGLLVVFTKIKSEYRKISLIFLALSIATILFPDINERFRFITTSTSWLFFISSLNRIPKYMRYICVSTFYVAFLSGSIIAYRSLIIGDYHKLFFPYIMTICSEGYSDSWIEKRIDDGDVLNLY